MAEGPNKTAEEKKRGDLAHALRFRLGVPLAQKIFFAENLRVMIRAGLSYTQAFHTLILQAEHKRWRAILTDVAERIDHGETFASALAHHEDFPPLFVNMIRVGEVSGTLERSLEELTVQMKKELAMSRKIRGAMLYPAIVLSATLLISIAMLIFVIPNILTIFKEVNATLPLATRILIRASEFLLGNGVLVGILVVVGTALLVIFSRLPGGKRVIHALLIRLWIIGPIIRKVNIARATRTLGTLLRTSVPVVEAFQVTADVLGNVHFRDALRAVAGELAKGIPVAESIGKHGKLFPPLVVQMVTVGEQSGKLDEMLSELANYYEAQVDETLGSLTQIIEPILILVLGAAVGFVAVAIISPIYSLAEQI